MEFASYETFDPKNASKQDATLLVKFELRPMQDKSASAEAGRPIFTEREFIDIRVPGDRDAVIRPATPRDIARFPDHYKAFKERVEAPSQGTPLAEWPHLSRSAVEELAYINVKTVEQLAKVNDNAASKFHGLMKLKAMAAEWLELAEDDAPLIKLREELEQRDAKIAAQADLINKMSERLTALEKASAAPPPAQEQTIFEAAPTPEVLPEPATPEVKSAIDAEVEKPDLMATLKKRRRRRTAKE